MADTPSLLNALIKPEAPVKKGRNTFATAMQKMGFTSVFDIVLLPKAAFARQLARYSDANADLAYDNAMGYAALIARLYREYKTSSGTVQQLARRSGLRALVPSGPTFQGQFKENWDEYCEVGAIADATGPVAYLSALTIFASQLEDTSTDAMRLLMEKRRPDLKDLLITHESTFTPRPMLEIVNEVLERHLRAWLDRNPADKARSIHEVLADRHYPFELPYNFYHHQCRLGLDDKKPQLGELNYLASLLLPIKQAAANDYGQLQQLASQAQRLLCGLSPQQQQLLIEPSVFSDFYLTRSDLIDGWQSPLTAYLRPHTTQSRCYLLLPGQADIVTATPLADTPTDATGAKTAVSLTFHNDAGTQLASIDLSSNVSAPPGAGWLVNRLHAAGNSIIAHFKATTLPTPTEQGYIARFELITVTGTAAEPVRLARQRFALTLDEQYSLTSTEQDFLKRSYGIQANSDSTVWQLTLMTDFMQRTGLNAEQVEQLVARRRFEVRVSPSCPDLQPARNVGAQRRTTDKVSEFSYPDRYGACYVNGTGPGTELYEREQETSPEKVLHDDSDNAIGLEQTASADSTQWRLTKVSLDRLDRLQRMARLHRWTGIPFAHLDTLIISAIRAEGEANLGMELNENTLRALGVYRYLNHHYSIEPEQFAALMHDLSPYASGKDQVPLFDQVFNRVQLFDTPLILDQSVIDLTSGDAATLKTVLQLCAGLKVQPTEDSFLLIAAQTNDHFGSLRRDLPTISSLYRQTLVAQLFGHSVAEVLTLAKLLGGNAFLTALVGGHLSARTETPAPDILDVLMILHWAFDWLKQSQQTVDRLQQRLGPPALLRADTPEDARRTRLTEETLSDDLRARLVKLQRDTRQSLITKEQVAALGLPPRNGDSGGEINWFKLLDDHDLISSEGLIAGLDKPLTLMDEPIGWLETGVASLLQHLILQPEVKAACAAKLIDLLLRAHDHQSQLLEGLFQETAQLPADRCNAVIHWAHSSIYSILLAALEHTLEVLIEHFQRVSRHAQIIVELRLSNSALRAFVVNPAWLGGVQYTGSGGEPTLSDLYLLERFSHWFHSQSQPEDSLLSYFTCANPPKVQLKNKALRQLASETANAALAHLLEWSEAEISTLTDILPDKRASSMAHVDWVRRCQAACQASGLSATALLQATDLTDTSSLEDWKAVGQAVMATHSAAAAAMATD